MRQNAPDSHDAWIPERRGEAVDYGHCNRECLGGSHQNNGLLLSDAKREQLMSVSKKIIKYMDQVPGMRERVKIYIFVCELDSRKQYIR